MKSKEGKYQQMGHGEDKYAPYFTLGVIENRHLKLVS